MTEELAVKTYPNTVVINDAWRVNQRGAMIVLRYSDIPEFGKGADNGWNIQKSYYIRHDFYQKMYGLMGTVFEKSLKEMVASEDGRDLDDKLSKDNDFIPVDYNGQAAHIEYFKTGRDRPRSPNSGEIRYELHYTAGEKHGTEKSFALPYESSHFNEAYLSHVITWHMGKKHGPETCYMPWERTFFNSDGGNADYWNSLLKEYHALHEKLDALPRYQTKNIYYRSDENKEYKKPNGCWEPIQAVTYSGMNRNNNADGIVTTWHDNSELANWGQWEAGIEDYDSHPIGDHYHYDRYGQLREITCYPEIPEIVDEVIVKGVAHKRPRILYKAQFDENGKVVFAATYGPNNVKCLHTFQDNNLKISDMEKSTASSESNLGDDYLPF